MANIKKCCKCNGVGTIIVLISEHNDKKEWITCPDCKGKGIIHQMTPQEEANYHADYWFNF